MMRAEVTNGMKKTDKQQRAEELKKFLNQQDVKQQRLGKASSEDIAKLLSKMLSEKQ